MLALKKFGLGITSMPLELRTLTAMYTFVSKKGHIFISGYTSNIGAGIWKVDTLDNKVTKVYSTGQWDKWFEDSNGNIFVSHSSSSYTNTNTGILKWDGDTFSSVYGSDDGWHCWFQSSKGDLFVASNWDRSKNILKWNGSTFISVGTGPSNCNFTELPDGRIIATKITYSSTIYGISIYDESSGSFVIYRSDVRAPNYIFISSTGDIFLSNISTPATTTRWNGTGFVDVYTGIITSMFEAGDGNIFAIDSTRTRKWNGTTFEEILNIPLIYRHKDAAGNLFGSNNSFSVGIYKWNGTNFIQAYNTSAGYWQYWFESSNGDVFASISSNQSNGGPGIVKYNGTNFVRVYDYDSFWENYFESSYGDLFALPFFSGRSVLRWDGEKFIPILEPTVGSSNYRMFEENGEIYLANDSLSGLFKYNRNKKKFELIRNNYSSSPFTTKLKLFGNGNMLSRIYTSDDYLILGFRHSTKMSNGDYGFFLSSDKTKIVYTVTE